MKIQLPSVLVFMKNKFWLSGIAFALWMCFLDSNSLLIHLELSAEISELEEGIEFYNSELKKDKQKLIELTSDPILLEKFAREEYWLCKANEEIFLISHVEDEN
jgi:cell division protein DivIC